MHRARFIKEDELAEFSSITEARRSPGLRMVCLRGIPSPWTEAAKGIFRCEGIECVYAAQSGDDPPTAIADWAGDSSVPVVAYNDEPLRKGWADILILSQRLAQKPSLVPREPEARAMLFGLAHEICGEMGLGWCRRLLMVAASITDQEPNFPKSSGERIGRKYGFYDQQGDAQEAEMRQAHTRVIELLQMFSARADAHPFLMGDTFCALDIYWATFANLFLPLPDADLPMHAAMRSVYTCTDSELLAAISPRLRDLHRRVYDDFLELPVPL